MLADTNRPNSRDLVDEGEQDVGEPFADIEAEHDIEHDIVTGVQDSIYNIR